MKTIRMTYRYSDVNRSLPLVLFFRMVGVYVMESFLHPRLDFKQELSTIGAQPIEIAWNPCDADIFLPQSLGDIDDYENDLNQTLVILNDGEFDNIPLKNIVYYQENERDFLSAVIEQLRKMRIIESRESEDLKKIVEVLFDNKYVALVLKCNAMLPKNRADIQIFKEESIQKNVRSWRNIIDAFLGILKQENVHKWGESCGERIQYSIANASYALDFYCKKMGRKLEILPDSLITICDYMENFYDDSLQNALMVLKAQVCLDLLEDVTKGYHYLLSICDRYGDYNAYAYFLKGNYWLNNAQDYENAEKYYVRAIERFPEYYRAWYRLGVAYYKIGDKEKALTAFESVIKILKPRMLDNKLRVRETEHLFLAYKYSGNIYYEKYDNLRMAIHCYKNAWNVYDNIEESTFYSQMGIGKAMLEKIREHTRKIMETDGMRERLQYWQSLAKLTMGETV